MPALQAFGRRWNLGSDDFVYPGIVEILVRGIWVVILLVVYLLKHDGGAVGCHSAWKVTVPDFFVGTIVVLVIHIVLISCTIAVSARGAMRNTAPRRHVASTLYARIAVLIPEVGWSILGAFLTFRKAEDCHRLLVVAGRGVVIVEWIIIATIAIAIIFMFDPLGRRHVKTRYTKDYEQIWKRRCRVLCCCVSGDENRQGAFEEIADLLTKFFKGKDIVLTDIIAGLVLLNAQQKFNPDVPLLSATKSNKENGHSEKVHLLAGDNTGEQGTNNPPISNETEAPDTPPLTITFDRGRSDRRTSKDSSSSQSSVSSDGSETEAPRRLPTLKEWMTLENAEYYSKYAVGSYAGYNYTMFKNCGERLPLCRKYRCCCCRPPRIPEGRMEGDNSCECQTAALLHYTGIDPNDIIFANFDNQIYETPYFIALDDSRKTMVIAIRGTKTFQDAVTDLTAYGEKFDVDGIPPGNVHGGILKVARHIEEELEKINFRKQVPEGYNVVVTGHSLGAGAAVILSMFLRTTYPDLRCFAYSPPGGLVSLAIQMQTEEFVCSVVLGNDLVPRLSLLSMEKFKLDLLKVIKRSKIPKFKIIASGFMAMCCGRKNAIGENLLVSKLPGKSSTSRVSATNTSKASIATNKLFDINGGGANSSPGMASFTTDDVNAAPANDTAGISLPSKSSAVSLGEAYTDSDVESVDSQPGSLRRHKDGASEPRIRPTTFQQFHQSHNKWKKDRADRRTGLMVADPLYLPGQVLHVIEDSCTKPMMKPTFRLEQASVVDFAKIVVCPNMLHHHHGYILRDVLQQMVRRKRFTSESSNRNVPVVSSQPPNGDHIVRLEQ